MSYRIAGIDRITQSSSQPSTGAVIFDSGKRGAFDRSMQHHLM